MRNIIHIVGTAVCLLAATSRAADLVIEDKLQSLPSMAVAVLKASADGSNFKSCKFVGTQVDLDGDGKKTDWAVTTDDACGWGAALGPIWLLRARGHGFELVLSAGGYDLTLGVNTQSGLRHVAIASATASHSEKSLWKFDGAKYVRVE
jgi:hypothetical protein